MEPVREGQPISFHSEGSDALQRLRDENSNFSNMVGSPEPMTSMDRHRRSTSSTSSTTTRAASPPPATRPRPILNSRSISSPYSPAVPASRSLPPHAPSPDDIGRMSASASSPSNDRHQRDRQWSLFEQLMENEGLNSPLPTSRPSRSLRQSRVTSKRISSSPFAAHAADNSSAVTDPFLTERSPSPINEDPHIPPHSEATTRSNTHDSFSSNEEDDSYDSDTEATSLHQAYAYDPSKPSPTPPWYSPRRLPTIPLLYRNILKCAIAYFIGSLFTYNPYLSGLISDITSYRSGDRKPVPSGHMVATIAVYFNPAKTRGAMFEADLFCSFGLLYSSFVCLASMGTFWWLELKPGWEWLGDVTVILWIGVSMSFVAWMKVYMGSPQFNTACSMIAITLFAVIVKEGGLETLLQVALIVVTGSVISNLVCHLIFPQTATANLQTNMTKTLDSFSTLLTMLTNAFLLEEGLHHPSQGKLQEAVKAHQGSFTSLKKDLEEAKSEWLYGGPWSRARDQPETPRSAGLRDEEAREGLSFRQDGKGAGASMRAYQDAVDSLTRLAQHLNGLRSGTRLQYELTKAGLVRLKGKAKNANGETVTVGSDMSAEGEEDALLKAAATMFGDLVDDLGPPLKALSTLCGHSLKSLRDSFAQSRTHRETTRKRRIRRIQPQDFMDLVEGLERALLRFESTSNHAVLRLYRKSDLISASVTAQGEAFMSASSSSWKSDGEKEKEKEGNIFTQGDNEHVFLVYFFIFTLQEFARELVSLVDAMERIYSLEQERVHRGPWWKRILTGIWGLIKRPFSKSKSKRLRRPPIEHPSLRRRISHILPAVGHRHTHPSFPKVRPHAPNTMQTPPRTNLSFFGKVGQMLWSIGNRLRQRDAKYAIKAGMATALLAAPAFFDSTRTLFVEWWGDWALISFFVVLSPTIGATNFLSFHRVFGTIAGACIAAGIYTLFPDNAIVLPIFGFFFSLPCFYYIVGKPQYASSSRFVLLTYNLTCLYCYNLREADISAVYVGFHRAVAVTIGVVWAAFVARFWWPAEARRELGKSLGEFCLNMGWLYTRLVASNSYFTEAQDDHRRQLLNPNDETRDNALASLSPQESLSNSIREFMSMELHLQIKLIELQGLLAQTVHEPRLKGPFPVQLYREILTSLQTILDRFHSMRCVTTREEWYQVRNDFIIPVNRERREMVGNIILYFSTLASAFRLKAPLPPYLPPAEKARQRLVDAIRQLDVVRTRDVKGSRHLLFFAYALNLKGVTEELESLGRTLQTAFGVIGQTPEEFEALFESETTEGRERIEHAA
ncbi:hypothetical protein EYR38_006240 [Pleurotus pulmonarius]|nr:hypothetical protein EYR38_006240 [Pleurotus pulmonarius]